MSGLDVAHAIGERLLAIEKISLEYAVVAIDEVADAEGMTARNHAELYEIVQSHYHNIVRPVLQFIQALEESPSGELADTMQQRLHRLRYPTDP
jgi:hypothetical protein